MEKSTNRGKGRWKRIPTIREWRPGLTEVRQSTIPEVGKGLFALVDMEPGDRIARFSGDPMTESQVMESQSSYVLQVSDALYLNAENKEHWEGRYIKDGPQSGRKANSRVISSGGVQICEETGNMWVYVIAICSIKSGLEILMWYGGKYGWRSIGEDMMSQTGDTVESVRV